MLSCLQKQAEECHEQKHGNGVFKHTNRPERSIGPKRLGNCSHRYAVIMVTFDFELKVLTTFMIPPVVCPFCEKKSLRKIIH